MPASAADERDNGGGEAGPSRVRTEDCVSIQTAVEQGLKREEASGEQSIQNSEEIAEVVRSIRIIQRFLNRPHVTDDYLSRMLLLSPTLSLAEITEPRDRNDENSSIRHGENPEAEDTCMLVREEDTQSDRDRDVEEEIDGDAKRAEREDLRRAFRQALEECQHEDMTEDEPSTMSGDNHLETTISVQQRPLPSLRRLVPLTHYDNADDNHAPMPNANEEYYNRDVDYESIPMHEEAEMDERVEETDSKPQETKTPIDVFSALMRKEGRTTDSALDVINVNVDVDTTNNRPTTLLFDDSASHSDTPSSAERERRETMTHEGRQTQKEEENREEIDGVSRRKKLRRKSPLRRVLINESEDEESDSVIKEKETRDTVVEQPRRKGVRVKPTRVHHHHSITNISSIHRPSTPTSISDNRDSPSSSITMDSSREKSRSNFRNTTTSITSPRIRFTSTPGKDTPAEEAKRRASTSDKKKFPHTWPVSFVNEESNDDDSNPSTVIYKIPDSSLCYVFHQVPASSLYKCRKCLDVKQQYCGEMNSLRVKSVTVYDDWFVENPTTEHLCKPIPHSSALSYYDSPARHNRKSKASCTATKPSANKFSVSPSSSASSTSIVKRPCRVLLSPTPITSPSSSQSSRRTTSKRQRHDREKVRSSDCILTMEPLIDGRLDDSLPTPEDDIYEDMDRDMSTISTQSDNQPLFINRLKSE